MKIDIDYLEGKKIKASFNSFEVISDQSKSSGGQEESPEPFDYFPASTALCVAHYIRSFCEARKIDYKEVRISQDIINIDEKNKYKRKIKINIEVPESFPEKYKRALVLAANGCTVKKIIENVPVFEVEVGQ